MDTIVKRANELLKEGRLQEYENFLIENLVNFPRNIQVNIIATLIEAEMVKETEKLKILNSILELLP
jgi:hypothetical protein